MSALAEVTAAGGRVWADGDKLRYRLPKERADLLDELKAHKAAVLAELKANDVALLALCREACRGLRLPPSALRDALNENDRVAMLSGDPDELAALRCAAEILAERVTGIHRTEENT